MLGQLIGKLFAFFFSSLFLFFFFFLFLEKAFTFHNLIFNLFLISFSFFSFFFLVVIIILLQKLKMENGSNLMTQEWHLLIYQIWKKKLLEER